MTKENVIKMLEDFKKFILRGNAVDMAFGIIIGVSFTKVVSSLVSDVLMPPIGLVLGGVNFEDLKIILKKAVISEKGRVLQPAVTINYGHFLQVLIDFLIIAFVVFSLIKIFSKVIKKEDDLDWSSYIKK